MAGKIKESVSVWVVYSDLYGLTFHESKSQANSFIQGLKTPGAKKMAKEIHGPFGPADFHLYYLIDDPEVLDLVLRIIRLKKGKKKKDDTSIENVPEKH